MNNELKITGNPVTGELIERSKKNPENAFIRICSAKFKLNRAGFPEVRKTIIKGKFADLQALGLKIGDKIDGAIVYKSSFFPFYKGQESKRNPVTKNPVLLDGREVYQIAEISHDEHPQDIFLDEVENNGNIIGNKFPIDTELAQIAEEEERGELRM